MPLERHRRLRGGMNSCAVVLYDTLRFVRTTDQASSSVESSRVIAVVFFRWRSPAFPQEYWGRESLDDGVSVRRDGDPRTAA